MRHSGRRMTWRIGGSWVEPRANRKLLGFRQRQGKPIPWSVSGLRRQGRGTKGGEYGGTVGGGCPRRRLLGQQLLERIQGVGLAERLIPAAGCGGNAHRRA